MSTERVLRINAPSVVGEIIDGEAVIMDLASGHYFSTQDVGCEIWRGLEGPGGASRQGLVRFVQSIYDVSESEVASAVNAFVNDLLERNLVVEVDAGSEPGTTPAAAALAARRNEFAQPVLHAYTDMEELLMLDPIHDVDESGWPMPKVPDGTEA